MIKRSINNYIPNELQGFRKIFFSITSYISSLLDIGYGTGSDKATATVLVIASIFLSFASGYTTFSGLTQYTPRVIAFLITLGVQGLLFGVSWRLGKLYVAGEISPAMWSVWFVTMLVSVFFSYSSLFETVYSKEERKENSEIASKTIGGKILTKLDEDLKSEFSSKKLNINDESYRQWKQDTISTIDNAVEYASTELARRNNAHQELINKYNYEIKNGGTEYINGNGKKALSTPGSGTISDQYKKAAEDYQKYDLEPYRKTSEKILEVRKEIYRNMADFEKSKDAEKLNSAYSGCVDLLTDIGGKLFSCNPDSLGDTFRSLVEVQKRHKKFSETCSNDILENSFDENVKNIRRCIRESAVSEEKADEYLKVLNTLQRDEGSHTHFFIIVINELKRFNYLAIGTLILALAIDLLILLCSLVASKHNTFLSISDAKDLQQMKNYPLDIVLGTNTEAHESDGEFIKRIKAILNNSTFNLEYAMRSYSMIIPIEEIIKMGMHKELGTFFSMNLARSFKHDDGIIIAFRTNFILWMCEQITKKNQSTESYSELYKAFSGESYGE